MTQLALDYSPHALHPKPGTQADVLLREFYKGRHLTVAQALNELGIYALSQRVGELKRLGWPIQSQMVETKTGKHIACYWIEFQ